MLKSSCILILNLLVFVIFRNELALKQMATIFLVIYYIYIRDSQLNRPESVSLALSY